jgi:WD40 repeat protein
MIRRLLPFLSALKPTRLGVLFAVLVGLGVGLWQWNRPPQPRAVLENIDDYHVQFLFSSDGKNLATASTNSLTLWDTYSGEKRFVLLKDDHPGAVAFSADGLSLACISLEKIRLWETTTGRELAAYQNKNWIPWFLAFSPEGKLRGVRKDSFLCDLADNKVVAKVDLSGFLRTPGDNSILVVAKEDHVKVWDLATGAKCIDREVPKLREFQSVRISSDRRFLIGTRGAWGPIDVIIFDLISGQKQSFPPAYTASGAALTPDGQTLAWARTDSFTPKQNSWLQWLKDLLGFQKISFSGKNVSLNSFPSGDEVFILRDCEEPLFSPDGKTLAVLNIKEASTEQSNPGRASLQLWDFPIRKPIGKILGVAALAALVTLLVFSGLGWLRLRRMRLKANVIPNSVPTAQ